VLDSLENGDNEKKLTETGFGYEAMNCMPSNINKSR
jgi:hypothetical protein